MEIQYLIFINDYEAVDLINQINTCMSWPDDQGTITWMINPDAMCEFDLQTGQKLPIGYGVEITDRIIDCLTPAQKKEILILPSNINTCVWQPEII
jgi:hypothetical protein